MRVAAVTYDYYPFDVRVRRLAEAAVDNGFDVDVFCLRHAGEAAKEIYNGVRIFRVPYDRDFGQSLPRTLLSWAWFAVLAGGRLGRRHLRERYDVVHVHNMPDFLVFSALAPKLRGAKVILDVQDVSPELMAAKAGGRKRKALKTVAAWQERVSTRFADHVVTVGWPFEEALLRRGVRADKLTSILNSPDPKIFPAHRRVPAPGDIGESQPLVLMYHGTVAERNGLDTAVRALALARVAAPNLRLDIMGRGEHVPALKALAGELGVEDIVHFSVPVPAENIVDFVLHGDVGIIPYRVDGFQELVLPTKAYELAWMGRPIIASDTPAIRSMFRPGSVALCTPSDPQSFAEAIVDLYWHPEKRRQMVEAATLDYAPYRWEAMSERYCELLRQLAGAPRRGRRSAQTAKASAPTRAPELAAGARERD